jgi:hypothetical protein
MAAPSVPGYSEVFAVGDTAAVMDQGGIPGTAPAAKRHPGGEASRSDSATITTADLRQSRPSSSLCRALMVMVPWSVNLASKNGKVIVHCDAAIGMIYAD